MVPMEAKVRAWNKLDLLYDSRDRELFAASTVVKIGNGKVAKFWTSSWADGTRHCKEINGLLMSLK
jgi:hypothetical protein